MDLVIHPTSLKPPIAVEIKASSDARLTKGNWIARDDLAPRATFVVYPGQDRYPIEETVEALPVGQLAAIAEAGA